MAEHRKAKRIWEQPKLVILVRGRPEELVLLACKTLTNSGADTAIVLKPVYTADVLNMKVREILCKPHF